ncbi:MAG: plasmid mobilization protein [Caldilineaceae bacterium]
MREPVRDKKICIRVTAEERARYKAHAATMDLSLSEFVRLVLDQYLVDDDTLEGHSGGDS